MRPQPPCAQHLVCRIIRGSGLGWHGPTGHRRRWSLRARVPLVVGAPNRSLGYGVVAPPRIWSRGIPNAAHCTSPTAFLDVIDLASPAR